MLKADFEALVSSAINRGTSFDAQIPGAVRRAMSWFERNYNFPHMKGSSLASVNSAASTSVSLGLGVKKLVSLWYNHSGALLSDGSFEDLYPVQIERSEADHKLSQAWPEWFTLGHSFTSPPNAALTADFGTTAWPGDAVIYWLTYKMTDYATFSASNNQWLLTYAEDAMLAKTMLYLLPFIRQGEKQALWQEQFAAALPTVIQMAEQMEYGPQDLQLEYS